MLTAARLAAGGAPVDGGRLLGRQGRANLVSAGLGGLPVAVLSPPTLALRAAPDHRHAVLVVYLVVLALAFTVGQPTLVHLLMAAVAGAVFVAARGLLDPGTPLLVRRALAGTRGRMEAARPLAVVFLVVSVGLLQGLSSALFVGALAAACLLALELRRGVVLAVRNGRSRRSRRVRSAPENRRLTELGDASASSNSATGSTSAPSTLWRKQSSGRPPPRGGWCWTYLRSQGWISRPRTRWCKLRAGSRRAAYASWGRPCRR